MLEVKKLSEILGHEEIASYLKKDLKENKFSQSYMFIGKRGIGKKTLALAFAKSILCLNRGEGFCGSCPSCLRFDKETYSEFLGFFDNGEKIKIDDIRRIIEEENLKRYEGDYRIVFIENGDRMTIEAANTLLKTLEEPIPGTIFLFTVNNKDDILPTILSRVEKYYLSTLKEEDLNEILKSLGYEDSQYLKLGTIDEARVILDNKDDDLLSYDNFKDFLTGRDLERIFKTAEKLSKKPYLKELLSYYQLEAARNFKESKNEVDYRIFKAVEAAFSKFKINVNERHILEYCFLTIGGIFSE